MPRHIPPFTKLGLTQNVKLTLAAGQQLVIRHGDVSPGMSPLATVPIVNSWLSSLVRCVRLTVRYSPRLAASLHASSSSSAHRTGLLARTYNRISRQRSITSCSELLVCIIVNLVGHMGRLGHMGR